MALQVSHQLHRVPAHRHLRRLRLPAAQCLRPAYASQCQKHQPLLPQHQELLLLPLLPCGPGVPSACRLLVPPPQWQHQVLQRRQVLHRLLQHLVPQLPPWAVPAAIQHCQSQLRPLLLLPPRLSAPALQSLAPQPLLQMPQ